MIAPPRNPKIVGTRPPSSAASSTSSYARVEMSTPAPSAMIEATTRFGIWTNQATAEPARSAPPAIRPLSAASHSPIRSP
jgi:hypothetical protein